ncbi:LysR family transcriptional regulator [Ideonella azotifigens]|uniref:LysR family transcriptional regulator n=1 Tax=Ideonella azotifigens TaxID=513160 RepID=A0ABN1KLZ7_9BURK|nr:LysR family transcriptional regulator [Ideonella azotifigens]MCD2343354.1 LysR family transcriptional regulator [Ideonella azotifigens]
MKLEDLEAFVAVVRMQSISAAAESLQLTQPTITRRVQNLEEALGVALLDRNVKPPRVNAMGREVHAQCRAVLREVTALRALVALDTRPSGSLRLGLTQGLGDLVLPVALARLREATPELTVQVSVGWAGQIVQRLVHAELDGAVVLLPEGHALPRDVQGEPLGEAVRLVVVGPRGAARKSRLRLADVAPQGWVLNPDGCGFRAGLQRALAAQGVPMDIRLETFGRELQLQMVAEGLGLGLVPEPLLTASAWREQLDVLPLSDFQPRVALWLLHARLLGKFEAPLRRFAADVVEVMGLGTKPAVRRRA